MYKKSISLGIILLFLLSGLSSTVIGFDAEKVDKSVQSVDGPMDSPWPMFGHDEKRTGQSEFGEEGDTGILKWKTWITEGWTSSSPAIGNDGTIYIGGQFDDKSLHAINPDGTIKWVFETNNRVGSSPLIDDNGTIYVGSDDNNLYAINPNGNLKWKYNLGSFVYSSPNIDKNNIIYVGSINGRLYAIYNNGLEKWNYSTDDSIYSSPVIDNNGIIYIGSHDYNVYAIYPNGTLKWKYQTNREVKSTPAIGFDGTIYVGSWDNYLYAINQNGTLKWKFNTGDSVETSPSIADDGTIYVGSYNGYLFSISPNGEEEWRYKVGTGGVDGWLISSPMIDKFGTIYAGSLDGYLCAINKDGTLKWKYQTGHYIESSPSIDEEGTIYFGSGNYLYALEIINNPPPNKPTISGNSSGKAGTEYSYTIVTTEPDDDEVSYYVDWGDGSTGGWTRYLQSGEEYNVSHIWEEQGQYTIRVKAKDSYETESEWTIFEVSMPKYKVYNKMLNLLHYILLEGWFD